MKKLLIVLLALTVIGVLAFAQDAAPAAKLSVGAWGRGWYTPIGSDGSNNFVSAGPSWGPAAAPNGPRVGVSFDGSSGNIGFDWNPGVSADSFTPICDIAKIWAQVNPMLKVEIGEIEGDVLRGKIDDMGDFVTVSGGADTLFTRFYPKLGMLLDVTPVDGLYIGAALDSADTAVYTVDSTVTTLVLDPNTGTYDFYKVTTTPTSASDAWKAIQVGAGYTIKDIGQFRAQYIGSAADKGYKVQAAFAYTGMAGLLVDLGATVLGDADKQDLLSLAATYNKDAVSLYGRVDTKFAGTSDNQFNFGATAEGYYTVAAPVAVGLEGSYTGMSASKSADDARILELCPAVKLGYSNGYLKVGFDAKVGLDGQDFAYQVPIEIEYSF